MAEVTFDRLSETVSDVRNRLEEAKIQIELIKSEERAGFTAKLAAKRLSSAGKIHELKLLSLSKNKTLEGLRRPTIKHSAIKTSSGERCASQMH